MPRTTIRIPEEKANVYREFLSLVKDQLHSDICYVTCELWEAFLTAMKNAPKPPSQPYEIKFAKQNIQINMGCNFYYAPEKPRREITPEIALNKNYFFPLLIEEWKTLKPEAKRFWRKQLQEAGILPKRKRHVKRKKPTLLKRISKLVLAIPKKLRKWIRKLRQHQPSIFPCVFNR